jgi:hypothetical protein
MNSVPVNMYYCLQLNKRRKDKNGNTNDTFNFYTNIVYIHNCNIVVPLEFILTITYKDIIAATVSGTNNFSSTTDTNPRIDLLLQYVLE